MINIQTGEWAGTMSGLGAGLDSFFEYLLKVACLSFFSLLYFTMLRLHFIYIHYLGMCSVYYSCITCFALLQAYILFGEEEDLQMFNESYETIKFYMRKGFVIMLLFSFNKLYFLLVLLPCYQHEHSLALRVPCVYSEVTEHQLIC